MYELGSQQGKALGLTAWGWMSLCHGIQPCNITTGLVAAGTGGLRRVQGGKQGAALFWGLPQHPLLMTQLCPRGRGWHWGTDGLTAVDGQGLAGGTAGQPRSQGYPQGCPRRAQPPGHRGWEDMGGTSEWQRWHSVP